MPRDTEALQRLWQRNQPEWVREHKTLWLERLCRPAAVIVVF